MNENAQRDEAAKILEKAKELHDQNGRKIAGAYQAIWSTVGRSREKLHAGDLAVHCLREARKRTNPGKQKGSRPLTDSDWTLAIELTKSLVP